MATEEPSYRESHRTKGAEYHDSFAQIPHRAMMWDLEQRALRNILRRYKANGSVGLLDFACGTGRVLGALAPYVTKATGVDVSASMLTVARISAPGAELLEADLTQDNALSGRSFDVITAFRFFPKAEAELRLAAMRALAQHLAPDGILIFNNHKQAGSLTQRVARLFGLGDKVTMTHDEVVDLVRTVELRIEDTVSLGVLPVSERWTFLPRWLLYGCELLLSHIPGLRPLSQNVIYVCRGGHESR